MPPGPAPRGMDPRMPHPSAMVGSGGQMLHPHMAQGRPPPGMGAEHLHGKVGGVSTKRLRGMGVDSLSEQILHLYPIPFVIVVFIFLVVNVADSLKYFRSVVLSGCVCPVTEFRKAWNLGLF